MPSSIEILQGRSQTIYIIKITSYFPITNRLGIKLRQKSTLDFVTIKEKSDADEVVIDTTGQAIGEYTLILESYNTLSVAKSALKTDTIAITIRDTEPPSFTSELVKTQVAFVGESAKWTVPEVVPGDLAFAEIIIEPDQLLSPYITYDELSR